MFVVKETFDNCQVDSTRNKDFNFYLISGALLKGTLFKKMILNIFRILSPFKIYQNHALFLRKQLHKITNLCGTPRVPRASG